MPLLNRAALRAEGRYHTENLLLEKAVQESRFNAYQQFDVFLSNRMLDAVEVIAIRNRMEGMGLTVYVDWQDDPELNRDRVNSKTAKRLKARMNRCKALVYAATKNASKSLWMPWELGFFDGRKNKVTVLPVKENPKDDDTFKGVEYLGIYPYVSENPADDTWIIIDEHSSPQTQSNFVIWVKGAA